MRIKKSILILLLLLSGLVSSQIPQVAIPRIELMPNVPSPYLMRDWEQVTLGYDALVYDITKTGDYFPLVFTNEVGVNYPQNKNFGLDTYVGTFSNKIGEAINVLPSLIGATLVGIDKSNQNSNNWVLMGQDFFNKREEENVYLNNIEGSSGNDWWYDIMPNIYFYQLNDLYPNTGDANLQFTSIADQWLKAVKTMGGAATPWEVPLMNYRAWNLATMTPNEGGVKEPEAAGGIAWLLYHAYLETGNMDYLQGAEWSMEYLNSFNDNPSYELQLPYGVYAAARMNAQLGTSYDVGKMLNWTFDRGDLRGWGAIVGNWNGYDVAGLIGEANDQGDDYAFLMNGFQQAGALVPMVRYDKRFARAIGKWMLNVANASRLLYSGFLPTEQQDASSWSVTYDPNGYIGYEGLREMLNNVAGPFSTGDAVINAWGNTNLALYGSSSVGVFGGIIKTTNVEKILQLDLLKTDFYRETSYPTYLYYNPYASNKMISIDVGTGQVDLYDALTETFLLQNVSGNVDFTIAGDNAVELVIVPAGGTISYDINKMLINNVVVDYMQTNQSYNYPPRVKSLGANDELLEIGGTTTVFATAIDWEGGALTYTWSQNGTPLAESGASMVWTAPETIGNYQISLAVTDDQLNQVSSSLQIQVVDHINTPPTIIEINSNKSNINPLEDIVLTCIAEDVDTDALTYSWIASGGTISGVGESVQWKSPSNTGIYEVKVTVDDGNGGVVESAINFQVKDYSIIERGNPVVYYPFTGNANDNSGHQLHGQILGASLTKDIEGTSDNAYYFDGVNDYISVGNVDLLNFTKAITVSCWISPENVLSGTESFILSHGSWQNRWKLSINSGKVRWTLNTSSGIKDVDSSYGLTANENYHITATYDGNNALLYINGKLDGYTTLNGDINLSSVDFLVGQMLPDKNSYNYKGLIDEILIYDYALTPLEAISLMDSPIITGLTTLSDDAFIKIFPNPTTGKITIKSDGYRDMELVKVYNVYGQNIKVNYVRHANDKQMWFLDFSNNSNGIYFIHFGGLNNRIEKVFVSK